MATLVVRTANYSVEVDCSVVPTVQLVSLEVVNMVHCLVQLTQEGNTQTSVIYSAVVLLLLVDLVQLLKTMKFQWVHLVELADG